MCLIDVKPYKVRRFSWAALAGVGAPGISLVGTVGSGLRPRKYNAVSDRASRPDGEKKHNGLLTSSPENASISMNGPRESTVKFPG